MAEAARKTIAPVRDEAPEAPRQRRDARRCAGKARRGDAEELRRLKRRDRTRWMLFALVPIALIIGIYWYVTGGRDHVDR